ncbi:hypothetical protein B4144_2031 [Bacillus atrophaeus]|nr:hypothetical protein B4144_2031 [Bacillus atrophaeus]
MGKYCPHRIISEDDGTRLRLIEKELKALGGKIPSISGNSSGSTYTVKKEDTLTRIASPMTKGDKVKQIQKALVVLYFCPDKGANNYGVYMGRKQQIQLNGSSQ